MPARVSALQGNIADSLVYFIASTGSHVTGLHACAFDMQNQLRPYNNLTSF
jgi:hypothetical protein